MTTEMKDGLQQALSQFAFWLEGDHDAAKAVHDAAATDDQTWPLNQALLYLLSKAWPSYYATLNTDLPMVAVIRQTIVNLAGMEDDS